MIGVVSLIVVLSAGTGRAELAEGLAAFVETVAADLSSSPTGTSQFQSAKFDTAENLGEVDGKNRYLCWLKADPNRVGYIAVAGTGESFQILAFSATLAPPQYFLRHLQLAGLGGKPLDCTRVNELSFTARVPLVAAAPTFLGTEPFQISESAASVSSVLNYWQREKRILLFPHLGFEAPISDPEYTRRFSEEPTIAREPNDSTWVPFRKERDAVQAQIDIPRGQTTEQKCAFAVRAHSIMKPVVRQRLLSPINARERMEVLEGERASLDGVARMNISLRMRDAMLLQLDYMDRNVGDMRQNMKLFFKTRGRTVQLETSPFEKARVNALPAIITGPGGVTGVVSGYVDIGGEPFASVFFPRTGSAVIKSLAQKVAEARKASGLPPEPNWAEDVERKARILREAEEKVREAFEKKGIPYRPDKNLEQEFREGAERIRVGYEEEVVAEDHQSASSLTAENGVHLVRCSTLASWITVYVSEIGLGTNWGRSAKPPNY
jgi:hypothetical protein